MQIFERKKKKRGAGWLVSAQAIAKVKQQQRQAKSNKIVNVRLPSQDLRQIEKGRGLPEVDEQIKLLWRAFREYLYRLNLVRHKDKNGDWYGTLEFIEKRRGIEVRPKGFVQGKPCVYDIVYGDIFTKNDLTSNQKQIRFVEFNESTAEISPVNRITINSSFVKTRFRAERMPM